MVPANASGNHRSVNAGSTQVSGEVAWLYRRVEYPPEGQPMLPRAMASMPSTRQVDAGVMHRPIHVSRNRAWGATGLLDLMADLDAG